MCPYSYRFVKTTPAHAMYAMRYLSQAKNPNNLTQIPNPKPNLQIHDHKLHGRVHFLDGSSRSLFNICYIYYSTVLAFSLNWAKTR